MTRAENGSIWFANWWETEVARRRNAGAFGVRLNAGAALKGLENIKKTAEAAVRPAAQAGADELYLEARLRCPVSMDAHYFYGRDSKKTGVRYYFAPGTLRDSIYQVFSKDNSGKAKAAYHVAWNHRKAPYGYMVEYGTRRAPAHPFLRPAYDSRSEIALRIARATLIEHMLKVPGVKQ